MENHPKISAWMQVLLNDYTGQISLSKSKPTVDAYRFDVSRFLEYLHSKGLKKITNLKGQTIVSYLGYQKSLGKSDASLNRYYMAIRSFCRYLRITGSLLQDICLDVTAPMFKQKAPYVPSLCEIEGIL